MSNRQQHSRFTTRRSTKSARGLSLKLKKHGYAAAIPEVAHIPLGQVVKRAAYETMDDCELVELAKSGNSSVFRIFMHRHSRQLYRVARCILGDDSDAEDVVQETYLKAFENLELFRGNCKLRTWLTRIAINEALGRARKRRPTTDLSTLSILKNQEEVRQAIYGEGCMGSNPETDTSRAEVLRLLEDAVNALPEGFRVVFVMREMEQMTIEETASHLHIRPETIKTRLHRARRLLRSVLQEKLGVCTALHPRNTMRASNPAWSRSN